MVHVITKGPQIGDEHVGSTGTHRDADDAAPARLPPPGHDDGGAAVCRAPAVLPVRR